MSDKNIYDNNNELPRDAFSTSDLQSPDLDALLTDDLEKLPDATLENDGITINDETFKTYPDEPEYESLELSSDDIINLICDAIGSDIKVLYTIGRPGRLESALKFIQDKIKRNNGIELDLIELFKNEPAINAAIKLISKGFLAGVKFENIIKNNVKIIFLPNVNNIYVTVDCFGKGLHKYKNKLAITSFDERVINKAGKYLGDYGNLRNILRECKDIELYKKPERKLMPEDAIRALSKRDLVESVLNGELTINDLTRAKIDRRVIDNINNLLS